MKLPGQAHWHMERTDSTDGGREMNALHSTTSSAVVTRLHDVGRGTEKSGAASGGGAFVAPGVSTSSYMTVVDASAGGNGGAVYGEGPGERKPLAETADAEAAFTAYVQERRASLYATAYHLTGDRFEAEDLLQSALFSTYRAWDRISDKAAVGGYLRRTMTNLHISAWRRRKLNEYPTEELPETAGDTDAMRGTELRAVLWQALARLPELQRTMLVLRYYEGRTDPEIADDPRHQCRHGEVEHLAVAATAARGRGAELRP